MSFSLHVNTSLLFILGESQKRTNMLLLEFGFRVLHEFRSHLSRTPFIALTATATKDTRETVFEVLLMDGSHIVHENPNKENIAYVVQYIRKNAGLAEYFSWIADEVKDCGSATTRTIIYTQTIKQCATVYSTLKTPPWGQNL